MVYGTYENNKDYYIMQYLNPQMEVYELLINAGVDVNTPLKVILDYSSLATKNNDLELVQCY